MVCLTLVEGRPALFCNRSFRHGGDWSELKKRQFASGDPEYGMGRVENNKKRDKKIGRIFRVQRSEVENAPLPHTLQITF